MNRFLSLVISHSFYHNPEPQPKRGTLQTPRTPFDSQPCSGIDIPGVVNHHNWRFQHTIGTRTAQDLLVHDILIGPHITGRQCWELREKDRSGLCWFITAEGILLTPTAATS